MDEKWWRSHYRPPALAVCRALAVFVSWSFGVFEIVPCVLRGCRISVASLPCLVAAAIAAVVKGKQQQEQKKNKALNFSFFFFFPP